MGKPDQILNNGEEAKKLNAIFQHSQDGIIIISSRGIVESINPAAAILFGYSPEEVIDQNVKMLMPEPHQSAHDNYIQNYRSTGVRKIIGIGREVKGRRKDGSVFPFFLSVSEVKLDDHSIFTGFIHDISDLKAKEQEIRDLNQSLEQKIKERTDELSTTVNRLLTTNKKLEYEIGERQKVEQALRKSELEIMEALKKEKELGELKTRFVSMASHEFRTPLSTILSSAALIGKYQQTDQQDKRNKHIERIKSAVNNLTGILNDFLSLSRLEEGKITFNPERFMLYDLCNEVEDEVKSLLKKGQELKYQHPDNMPEVFLDRRLLKNILFNLLTNAIKYSPEDKPIHCIIRLEAEQLEIAIRDEGIGIPEEDQKHLFSRFFRAANVTNIQGTGLGLNIVRKYIEIMKGSIRFESAEGKGTSFTVLLPTKLDEL